MHYSVHKNISNFKIQNLFELIKSLSKYFLFNYQISAFHLITINFLFSLTTDLNKPSHTYYFHKLNATCQSIIHSNTHPAFHESNITNILIYLWYFRCEILLIK